MAETKSHSETFRSSSFLSLQTEKTSLLFYGERLEEVRCVSHEAGTKVLDRFPYTFLLQKDVSLPGPGTGRRHL